MRIYDITKELTGARPFPGHPAPYTERLQIIGEEGSLCNLSAFYACCHSATHIDAPLHFIADGKTTEEIPLGRFMGRCTVVTAKGILTGEHMDKLIPYCKDKILFKGNGEAFLTVSAAFALADAGVNLVGTDSQVIASPDSIAATHQELLNRDVVILEGLDLKDVPDGDYLLIAFPLKIRGVEGAPCRAVLIGDSNG